MELNCPKCGSNHIVKNGKRRGKQNYKCKNCGRQFVEFISPKGYEPKIKEFCINLYLNGLGFRGIERVTNINHNTVINWVKSAANKISDVPDIDYDLPQVGQIDELQTFVGKKTNKIWIWTAVDKFKPGILEWEIGDRSNQTLAKLWAKIEHWNCYFWATDGYQNYRSFIADEDHIISKTYMTKVEGENSRLRHYLARLHRKTFCYSKSVFMLEISVKLLNFYLKNNHSIGKLFR